MKFSHLILLFFLLSLSACAPLSSLHLQEDAGSWNDPANMDLLDGEILQDPCEPMETEQLREQELADLEKLGKWEGSTRLTENDLALEKTGSDFPLAVNKQVEFYLNWFQTKKRKFFTRTLIRSGKYLPMIRQKLEQAGLPRDLAYLAFIESGYVPTACSHAGAVGLWQFMKATGRRFDLRIDSWVDERRDPEKATDAAVRYLANLYTRFDSWHLAVAGYNAGEGKIERAIKKYKSRDFWQLANRPYLRLETKSYVPQLIATIIIAQDPELFGFMDIQPDQPVQSDVISVPPRTSLPAIAAICKIDSRELKRLNPELRRNYTPSNQKSYQLQIPAGTSDVVAVQLPFLRPAVETGFKTYIVKKGDTISHICSRYKVKKNILLQVNNLRSSKILVGQRLRIPYELSRVILYAKSKKRKPIITMADIGSVALTSTSKKHQKYTVASGDSLWIIARRFDTSIRDLKRWNNLSSNRLNPGKKLIVATESSTKKPS